MAKNSRKPGSRDKVPKNEPTEKADIAGKISTINPELMHSFAMYTLSGERFGPSGISDGLEELYSELDSKGPGHLEKQLLFQSELLNTIFTQYTIKMSGSKTIPQMRMYADIALKAQNQSRRTIMALADLKNPKRTTFIKQQNNAVNQQVNNGIAPCQPILEGSAEEIPYSRNLEIKQPNELMEEFSDVKRMDARKATEAV